jgi:hypothetical protein
LAYFLNNRLITARIDPHRDGVTQLTPTRLRSFQSYSPLALDHVQAACFEKVLIQLAPGFLICDMAAARDFAGYYQRRIKAA